MIARCARCQGTFTTDHFGRQTCPHCGSELLLADPNLPAGAPEQAAPPAGSPPPAGPPPEPPPAGGPVAPPVAAAPPGGWGPPPAAGGAPGGGWGGPPGGGWGPPPGGPWGGPPPPPPELPSPFAERGTRGFLAAFIETWKLVATRPQEFFRRVRIDQTGTAVLFGVIATTVGNALAALYSWLQSASNLAGLESWMQRMPQDESRVFEVYKDNLPAILLGSVVLAPVLTVVWTYLAAGVLHLLLMLFRGAKRPFDATLTAVAYASGLNLLLVVPICGGLVALVWGLVVLVVGLAEVQRCGTGKAAAAVFAPVILACVCCCAAFGATMPAFLKQLQDAAGQGKSVDL